MSALLDSAVFPGVQGGPLEHVIAAKAVSFGEALQPEYIEYQTQVKKNAAAMAKHSWIKDTKSYPTVLTTTACSSTCVPNSPN